jgi:hypothetical protein
MGRIEELAARYRSHIGAPWQRNLAGDQKAIFVVYPKTDERKLRARLEMFDVATTSTGHRWQLLDLTDTFARWIANTDYRDEYFADPGALVTGPKSPFTKFAVERLREALTDNAVDEDTVVAVNGAASFFGFTYLSAILSQVKNDIRGRLLVFFPGEYEDNNYRLLDARDGWSYLAVPITLHNGMND